MTPGLGVIPERWPRRALDALVVHLGEAMRSGETYR